VDGQNDIVISVIGSLVTALGVLALVIKSFLSEKKPANGYTKLSDIEDTLQKAVSGFRESHLEEKMKLDALMDSLRRIEANLTVCADILKSIPKRTGD